MELILGQIPESIYFAIFLIFAKQIKEKRILFTICMIFEYLFLKYTFQYNVLFHITYIFMIYILLKTIYGNKAQITDIFIVLISYLTMIIFSLFSTTIIIPIVLSSSIVFKFSSI